MSNEKFKVKFGLAVGDTAATIDATTGEVIAALGNDGQVTIGKGSTTNGRIDVGNRSRLVAGTPFIDFNSSVNTIDYDVRLIASGGSGTDGQGTLTAYAASIVTTGTIDVQGGTVTDSTGALSITTGAANGAITLDPNGTGNVVMTFANGGNLTNDRNYTLNAIRNTTTAANGNIWAYQTTTSPTRGVNLSNSGNETSYRPGIVLQGYSGGASGGRSWLVFENSRGTAASPTAVQNNDRIVEMIGQGYNGTQWTGDVVANQPFTIRGSATEAWTNSPSRAGMRFEVLAQPSGVDYTASSVPTIISHSPTTATYISDAWAFRTRTAAAGGSNILQMSLDVNGNAIITGDLRINGNDIQASDGLTNISMTSNTLTTLAGDIQVNGNDIRGSGGLRTLTMSSGNTFTELFGDNTNISNAAGTRYFNISNDGSNHIAASVLQERATSGSEFALTNFTTTRSTDGINFTPTQNGDIIGQFKFNGNANTSTSPGVPGGPGAQIQASATELWSSTANGTKIDFYAIKTGTIVSYNVISATPDAITLNADTQTLNNYNATVNYLTLNNTSATFTKPVGFPVNTAANWNAITGSVGQQVSVSNSPTVGGRMAFWDTTNARWSYVSDNSAV